MTDNRLGSAKLLYDSCYITATIKCGIYQSVTCNATSNDICMCKHVTFILPGHQKKKVICINNNYMVYMYSGFYIN